MLTATTKHNENLIQEQNQPIGQLPGKPGSIGVNDMIFTPEVELIDLGADLTDEDKTTLAMK